MTTLSTPTPREAAAASAVNKALAKYAATREGARRFHRETLGDVDPNYSFSDFLLLVKDGNDRQIEKRYGEYCTKAALAESSGQTGGYAVPQELRDDLMGDVAELAIFRPRATVVPMSTATLRLPYWDVTTATTKGIPPFWGGMPLSYISEASALPENEPSLRQLELRANLIGGTILVSQPFMQDAKGVDTWLKRAFAGTLAWYEDWYAINGDGAGCPQGLLSTNCKKLISRKTVSHYDVSDGQKMAAALYTPRDGNALWLVSRTTLADITGQTGWFPNGPLVMHGKAIEPTVLQPPLGTTGDVILTDPAFYVLGDREIVTIDASPYYGTAFQDNQLWWRVAERIDGQSLLSAAITIPDGAGTANTVSPVVILN